MADVLGVETYGYPKVVFAEGHDKQVRVKFSEGWFLPGIDEDEPAYYMDYYIDKNGKVILVIDGFWHASSRVLVRGRVRDMNAKQLRGKKTLICRACGSPNAEYDRRNNGLWSCPDCGASYFLESEFG